MLLDAYGWTGTAAEVLDAVRARIVDHLRIVRELADIHETLRQFDRDRSGLDPDQAG